MNANETSVPKTTPTSTTTIVGGFELGWIEGPRLFSTISGTPFPAAREMMEVHSRIMDKIQLSPPGPWNRGWPPAPTGTFCSQPDIDVWLTHHADDGDVVRYAELEGELERLIEAAIAERGLRRFEAEQSGILAYACERTKSLDRWGLGSDVDEHRFNEAVGWLMWPTEVNRWYSGIHNEWLGRAGFYALAGGGRSTGTEHHGQPGWLYVGWSINCNSEAFEWVRRDTVPPELLPHIEACVESLQSRVGHIGWFDVMKMAVRAFAKAAISSS